MSSSRQGASIGHLRGARALQEDGPNALEAFLGVCCGRGSRLFGMEVPLEGGGSLRTLLQRRVGGAMPSTRQGIHIMGFGVVVKWRFVHQKFS